MNFYREIKKTAEDESGAVTVDWVALTGATVAMVVALGANLETGLVTVVEELNSAIASEIAKGNGEVD